MTDTITIKFPISELTSKYGFGQGDLDEEFRYFVVETWDDELVDWSRTWYNVVREVLHRNRVELVGGLRLQLFGGSNPVRLVDSFGEPVSVVTGGYTEVSSVFTKAEVDDLVALVNLPKEPATTVGQEITTAPDHIREAMRHLQEAEYLTEGLMVSGELTDVIALLESFVIYGIRE